MKYRISDTKALNGVQITVTQPDGFESTPSYEAHSLDRVNEIIKATLLLVPKGTKLDVTIY
jgi:hypothetical protein